MGKNIPKQKGNLLIYLTCQYHLLCNMTAAKWWITSGTEIGWDQAIYLI